MERLIDKLVVLVACLPALFAVGEVGAAAVAALLVAVVVFCACEVAGERAARVLALAFCVAALCWPGGWPEALTLLPLAAFELASRSDAPRELAWTLVPVAACVFAPSAAPGPWPAGTVVVALASCWLGWRDARVAAERGHAREVRDGLRAAELELASKNRELAEARDYEVRLATLQERSRIAREIHDNVGHLLTRASVQAQALGAVHADDPAVAADFADVAATVGEALDEVRTSVHDLRDEASEPSVRLRQVCEDACAGTGLALDFSCDVAAMPPDVLACFSAIVREAASNTLRHAAGASHLHVEVAEHPALWRVSVVDDGAVREAGMAAARAPRDSRGMGLASMEERVRELGGSFLAGPCERGWRVFASVPKGAPAAAGVPNHESSAGRRS